VKYWVKY